jgi:hypothetical protein
MLRRRHINADPGASRLRSMLAAAGWPLRRVAWAVEDRLAGGGELLRGVADAVRWPFERLAWLLERRLVWPLRERAARFGPTGRNAGAAALAAIVVAVVLSGVLLLPGDGRPGENGAAARVAIATPEPEPQEQPSGPVLEGVSPNFGVAGSPAGAGPGDAGAELNAGSSTEAPESGDETTQSEEGAAAASSSTKPVPAGPAAMKVARRFSRAFVFYEVGEKPTRATTVFGETATPRLAEALAERPPRQPADAEVPKARVLNLVPGPRAGRAYTVSVSLLRVGLTSELRLELSKRQGQWLVTDVRG